MIEKNELRPGIFVKYKEEYWRVDGVVADTVLLVQYEALFKQFGDHKYTVTQPKNIEPIELTEKWLRKFGFTDYEDSENDCRWWVKGEIRLYEDYFRVDPEEIFEGTFLFPLKVVKGAMIHGVIIHNVHNLQNLYQSLCNEELP